MVQPVNRLNNLNNDNDDDDYENTNNNNYDNNSNNDILGCTNQKNKVNAKVLKTNLVAKPCLKLSC